MWSRRTCCLSGHWLPERSVPGSGRHQALDEPLGEPVGPGVDVEFLEGFAHGGGQVAVGELGEGDQIEPGIQEPIDQFDGQFEDRLLAGFLVEERLQEVGAGLARRSTGLTATTGQSK